MSLSTCQHWCFLLWADSLPHVFAGIIHFLHSVVMTDATLLSCAVKGAFFLVMCDNDKSLSRVLAAVDFIV